MSIDESTVASGTPRTHDGREYPTHLRPYEAYDRTVLLAAADLPEPFTFDDLAVRVRADPQLRNDLPRWFASAGWRRLVDRRDPSMSSPRTYVLTERGHQRLAQLLDELS